MKAHTPVPPPPPLLPLALRRRAAEFADSAISVQSLSFQRYGIYGDFENPYKTKTPMYEQSQLGVFKSMFLNGNIYRGEKPVNWSPSSRTALAEAELEYPEGGHWSRSVYVGFNVVRAEGKNTEAPPTKLETLVNRLIEEKTLQLAIWTTTAWTLPANLAVAINPSLSYSIVETTLGRSLICATELVQTVVDKISSDTEIYSQLPIATFEGKQLTDLGIVYAHPTDPAKECRLLAGGDYITTESGTGLVHTAPGHGLDDYLLGQKQSPPLPPFSPVDDAGKFNELAEPKSLLGLPVLGAGTEAVIQLIGSSEGGNLLLREEKYNHKYPYDWRTKKPTIFRSTPQWFCSVEKFRDQALNAISKVDWIPIAGENRMKSFVQNRGDWCISRQRSWGVPIPVFYDTENAQNVLVNEKTIDHIINIVGKHENGTDVWWELDEVDLLPEEYREEALAGKWRKGVDTMDVWFDSGTSWSGVLNGEIADMYLEGSDQHRGWFQSSLLTSVSSRGNPPYKKVLTHGFVLDEKGYKMSKSLGNVVDPMTIIAGGSNKKIKPAYGADVLRLWVASVDYTGDVCIGDGIMKQTFESYRRMRNIARYMLGNLHDFNPTTDEVPYANLPSLDKWILGRLSKTLLEVDDAYNSYQFNKVVGTLLKFATADLSNFYLDIAKDRLYISEPNSLRRRSCQTVLAHVLDGFTKAIAPILPHLAEDINLNVPFIKFDTRNKIEQVGKGRQSIFQDKWPSHLEKFQKCDAMEWAKIREIRTDINQLLELARVNKIVGSSLDAFANIQCSESDEELLRRLGTFNTAGEVEEGEDNLRYIFLLSGVKINDPDNSASGKCADTFSVSSSESTSGCAIKVGRSKGVKCARCWFFTTASAAVEDKGLCPRCRKVCF